MPARIADKMRIYAGERLYFANGPADAVAAIDLPAVHIAKRLAVFFTKTQRQLDARFPRPKTYWRVLDALQRGRPVDGLALEALAGASIGCPLGMHGYEADRLRALAHGNCFSVAWCCR